MSKYRSLEHSIKDMLESSITGGKYVGSRGGSFRKSSTSNPDEWRDKSGTDVGAARNIEHEKASIEKARNSEDTKEKEIAKRAKEAEQRKKETMKMSKEDLDEAKIKGSRRPGRSLLDDPRVQKALMTQKVLQGKGSLAPKSDDKKEVTKEEAEASGTTERRKTMDMAKEDINLEEQKYADTDTEALKSIHQRAHSDISHPSSKKLKMSNPGFASRVDTEFLARKELKKRGVSVDRPKHPAIIEGVESSGTTERTKIKNIARPNDADPLSSKSKLTKQAEIKNKVIDEGKMLRSDKKFGISDSIIEAAKAVMSGKTEVDTAPETNDSDSKDENGMKKESKHTKPKTAKEKSLAALAHPKDKITHKDVLVGRGVLAKEDVDLDEAKLSPEDFMKGARRAGTGTDDQLKASASKKNVGPGSGKIRQLAKDELKRRGVKEETDIDNLTEEQLEEALKKSDSAGKWISDFVHSKDPKFAGKTKKERMKMALGAYYGKQNEEVEQVDEVSYGYLGGVIAAINNAQSTKKTDVKSEPMKAIKLPDSKNNVKTVGKLKLSDPIPPGKPRVTYEGVNLTPEESARLDEIAKKFD